MRLFLTKAELEKFAGPAPDPLDRPIAARMRERFLELLEDFQATSDADLQQKLFEEISDLGNRLPMKRNGENHILTILDRMRDAGVPDSERLLFLERPRPGKSGAPHDADLSVLAFERHAAGESYISIAQDLCDQQSEYHTCDDYCADRIRQRVKGLKSFFRKWNWQIDRTGKNLL